MGVRAAGYCHYHRLPTRESPYGFPQSPADSTGLPSRAPVFNDEEKRAGATTHVGTSTFPGRNVPAEPQAIRAKLRGRRGRLWWDKSDAGLRPRRRLKVAGGAVRQAVAARGDDGAAALAHVEGHGSRGADAGDRFAALRVTALLNRTPPRGQCAALPC